MKYFFYLVPLILLLSSCTGPNKETEDTSIGYNASVITKSVIAENSMIDLPSWKELTKDGVTDSIPEEEIAQVKAALYRFYKHVKVQDGYYVCDLVSALDINVSEEIFNDLLNNLKEVNAFVKKSRSEGIIVELPIITDDYLNSLVN